MSVRAITTKPPPKLTQSTQRLLTAVLGQSALLDRQPGGRVRSPDCGGRL
jgi:hypothetical protein